jgi:hypothetical protein
MQSAKTIPRTRQRKLRSTRPSAAALRCRRKFLDYFPDGFRDPTYLDSERAYKQRAHERWAAELSPRELRAAIGSGDFATVAEGATAIESRTNLLFSFEKMALRDAVRTAAGARLFAQGLRDYLDERRSPRTRFERWCEVIAKLPRRQTRVLNWPIVTVFGFIARPDTELFLKPNVTRRAAQAYGFDFDYASRPNYATYASLIAVAARIRSDLADLRPRDMIDVQSFIWVQGSDEYPD